MIDIGTLGTGGAEPAQRQQDAPTISLVRLVLWRYRWHGLGIARVDL
ncbi:hypothetical protein SY89_03528 [Halolamina pelagica]|uniref:Uncharacterized protein n=1 Tax=Halolamina pelagica TaxID=699431 RepID=A0A0P7GJY5_9EURY|nr:hypothetical protein SY89_03528 [Halolamina pelagica]